jgi:acyl dehydratase
MSSHFVAPSVGVVLVDKGFPRITRTTLALYAGASGDHNPMHIDIDFAKKAGFPDVFAQGMLLMAMLGQALTDAVRPDRLRSFSTRFVAITELGAKIRCEGTIAELFESDGEKRARLTLTAKDETGDVKLSGEAVIAL